MSLGPFHNKPYVACVDVKQHESGELGGFWPEQWVLLACFVYHPQIKVVGFLPF